MLIIGHFNDDTNGDVNVWGMQVKGPTKLIIFVLGVSLIISGSKIQINEKADHKSAVAPPDQVSGNYDFGVLPMDEFRISKNGKQNLYFVTSAFYITKNNKTYVGFWIGPEEYYLHAPDGFNFYENQSLDISKYGYLGLNLTLEKLISGNQGVNAKFNISGNIEGVSVERYKKLDSLN